MSSPQIWNKEQETNSPQKRQSKRQASEAQWEKKQQRSRARDKKKETFFVGITTWKFCSGGNERRNASSHQCKVKMSGSEKKLNKNTYDLSLKKHETKKFLEVSHCSRAKQRQRNVQKNLLHRQNLLSGWL